MNIVQIETICYSLLFMYLYLANQRAIFQANIQLNTAATWLSQELLAGLISILFIDQMKKVLDYPL